MDSKNEGSGLEAQDDPALWELLGRERSVEVSPYFVRRVLRDLDAEAGGPEAAGGAWRAWWRPAWVLAGGTATAALVAVGVSIFSFSSVRVAQQSRAVNRQEFSPAVQTPAASAPPDAGLAADVSPQDVDVIADLDNLVAREETNVWTDDTSRF